MSETVGTNEISESNGGTEQPTYNGETEEHTSNFFIFIAFNYLYVYEDK